MIDKKSGLDLWITVIDILKIILYNIVIKFLGGANMAIQTPITIDLAMRYIESNDYLLPAFQRDFVWDSTRIEKLFDSLLCGYPFGTMLFWKVKGDTRTRWKFYRFIKDFILNAKDKSITNELVPTSNKSDFHAIMDGQQRLTAMRIGLYGSYAFHEPNKSWNYSPDSFPTRHLYLNLSKIGCDDEDTHYFFEFKKESLTQKNDFYIDNKEQLWYRVGSVVDYYNSGEEFADYYEDSPTNKEQRKIINLLKTTIFNQPIIAYYEEEEQIPDKAVRIFTRINSGGVPLPFSDIVFSLLVSQWEKKDAKNERKQLFESVTNRGFSIDNDYIIKAILYLYNNSVKTEINSFTKEFCVMIENKWDCIYNAVLSTFELLQSFGLSSQTLTTINATLPILYYIYHRNIYEGFKDKIQYKNDRDMIKKWLYITMLKRTFGSHTDNTLQQSRKAFTDNYQENYINENIKSFPVEKLNENVRSISAVSDEFLDELLNCQKDNKYAFVILSLLYPHMDYKNNNFNKDHIHPLVSFELLSEELKKKYPFKKYNSILNLQMLDENENKAKSGKSLSEWVKSACMNTDTLDRFLESHLIPNVDLSLENFDQFIVEREKMLKKKLKDILG